MSRILLYGIILLMVSACRKQLNVIAPPSYNPDWTTASHGNATPDYNSVFPQETVNKIEITVGAEKWSSIRTNMRSIYGVDFGSATGGPPPQPGQISAEPAYVDVTLTFNGKTWKNVGFRLKGNSTLNSAWRQGNYKLPFRLNFDEFEDKYPGILNQHFFGFEELTFSPGFKDQSLIREKLAADVFRANDIPAPQTAFYRVYVDLGAGMKYWGVYCCVEVPEDHMIKSQLGEESGNIYKPESNFTSFNQAQFEKKNNDSLPNFSDIQQCVSRLNSPLRTTDPAKWRTDLEAILNIPHFLKWLATNTAIVNWDTYGSMAHNYYLYNHSNRKLLWIPWDNNESFSGSPGITGNSTPGPGAGMTGRSLSMNEVANTWPLIRYLIDDPVYLQIYKTELKNFNTTTLLQNKIEGMVDKYYNLVAPFAVGINGEQPGYTWLTNSSTYTNERQALKTHLANRKSLISTYVP